MEDCASDLRRGSRAAAAAQSGDVAPRLTFPERASVGGWLGRLALVTLGLALLGLALPLLAPADRVAFHAINDVGYGSGWVFELLDPHERLYRGLMALALVVALVVRGPWMALGVAVALMIAGTVSYLLLEMIAVLTERPRPQEVFENILKPPGADWAQASYPSGHAAVTTALAAATAKVLRVLRWPMALLVVVIAWGRIAFGAHFPLDVLAAVALGYVSAAFAVALTAEVGLLPRRERAQRTR